MSVTQDVYVIKTEHGYIERVTNHFRFIISYTDSPYNAVHFNTYDQAWGYAMDMLETEAEFRLSSLTKQPRILSISQFTKTINMEETK